MLNSVGLQGPGVEAWLAEDLPALRRRGARVVASIWGRTVAEFEAAAGLLADATPDAVVADEVNVSCPNLEDRDRVFAHSPERTAEVVEATAVCGRPRWAKLSPNTDRLVEVAAAAQRAGAEAVTLVNTVVGMAIDIEQRRPVLGARKGGLSGPPVHAVAVRAAYDVHEALPDLPIVGVGGVRRGSDAVELLMAGASAVQVGTATFADPRAVTRVLAELRSWCEAHDVADIASLTGAAHERPRPAATGGNGQPRPADADQPQRPHAVDTEPPEGRR
jgi:dihydroorotate dehydrogenase (NAD+) catalytic subunit